MPIVQTPSKLVPIFTKKKRIKVAVGGRGGGKSISFADAFIKHCYDGERLCCAREFQNSIDESVHELLKQRNEELQAGLTYDSNHMYSQNGGVIFYKGLARNPDSIKSMQGVKRIWVEEAHTLSEKSLTILAPTIREAESELWFSLNRGSSNDPFSQKYLTPYEHHIARDGYYEDDDILIIEINYNDNPFFPDVLDQERRRDKELMTRAQYDHVWGGGYSDTVEAAIILPEWFDACVDAHKKLGFKAKGQVVASHDPADSGDGRAFACRHGSVFLDVQENLTDDVNDACDWSTDLAINHGADVYVYDASGLGLSLRRQVSESLKGKKIEINAFMGGGEVENAGDKYAEKNGKPITNEDAFVNLRAQMYGRLRDRMLNTYRAVEKGEYMNTDELISFPSELTCIKQLRSEVCQIPKVPNGNGRLQIMRKDQMKKQLKIKSPNLADCLMMTMCEVKPKKKWGKLNVPKRSAIA